VAKILCLRPIPDATRREAALTLARRAVESGQNHKYLSYFRMALGMAEYRSGNFAAAEESLAAAVAGGQKGEHVYDTAGFYRAMSLYRQGKTADARRLAEVIAKHTVPLPADDANPLGGNRNHDDLIRWLAYREAKALIGFDDPPAWAAERAYHQAMAAGRYREAVAHLAARSAARNHNDSTLYMRVAALQAWFGQDRELSETRRRILDAASATKDPTEAERTAKACCLAALDVEATKAACILARRAVDLGKDSELLPWFHLALGMAEYRARRFTEADASLRAAIADRHQENAQRLVIAELYRAMSLHQLGKNAEARTVALTATAKMPPLPKDDKEALAADHDDLIMWLAYKEAKALIGFDDPPREKK
jgi:hypothetical protein